MTDPASHPPDASLQSNSASPASASIDGDEKTWVSLKLEDWLTVLIMAALALITFANVVVRYLTNASLAWTEEFSVFLMILLALVAGSAAVARDRHIRIEYFFEQGSPRRRRQLAQLSALMVALLFAFIAVLSVRTVWDEYRFEETSPGIGVPQWWYSIWLPVVCSVICLRALGLFMRRRTTRIELEDDPSADPHTHNTKGQP